MTQVFVIPMAGYLVIMLVGEDRIICMTLHLVKKESAFVSEYAGSLMVIEKEDSTLPAQVERERNRHQGTALVTLSRPQGGGTLLTLRYRFPEMQTDITFVGDLVPGSRNEYQMAVTS